MTMVVQDEMWRKTSQAVAMRKSCLSGCSVFSLLSSSPAACVGENCDHDKDHKIDNHDVDSNGDGKMTFLKWTYTPYSKALPHHQTQAQCEFCHYPCTWPPKWIRRIVWYFLIRQTETDLKSKVWLKTSFVNPPIAKKWCSASAQDSLQFGLNNRKSYIFNASWRDLTSL